MAAADSAIRKGLKQISSNPGGIILDLKSEDIELPDLLHRINDRIKRSAKGTLHVLVKKDDVLLEVIQYIKK